MTQSNTRSANRGWSRCGRLLAALALGLGVVLAIEACAPKSQSASAQSSMRERIEDKAARAQKGIKQRAEAGGSVEKYMRMMGQAKKHFDAGEPLKGEAVLDQVLTALETDSAAPAQAGTAGPAEMRARIEDKAEEAKSLIIKRAQSGEDVRDYLKKMDEAKAHFDEGDAAAGEALLDEVIADLGGAPVGAMAAPATAGATGGYGEPELVTIEGYDSKRGTMEPFISRDGQILLFNNATDAFGVGTGDADLQYAKRNGDGEFDYVGAVKGANSKVMDGAPSLDDKNRIYFTSVRSYEDDRQTLYVAKFDDGMAQAVRFIMGDISKKRPGELNMDGEISADGETLYFSDNKWDTKYKIPGTSNLVIARRTGANEFRRIGNYDEILKNINTDDLEYAPATTADELTLYFTRARFLKDDGRLVGVESGIYMSTRDSKNTPFDPPVRISTISGFVEGPSVTADGKELYFHRKDGSTYRLYRVLR
jgi:hypothetical protein